MEDREAAEYVANIAQLLRSEGFDWVVDEVQAAIALGKVVRKEIYEEPLPRTLLDEDHDEDQVRRRRRSRRTSTEPLTSQEQLSLLISAIESAFARRADIEAAVLKELSDVQQINFVPEFRDIAGPMPGIHAELHHIDRENRTLQERTASHVRQVVERLKGQIDAG